jgi:ATP-binding cassette subfamily B protein
MYQSIGYSFFQSGKNILITYFAALMVMHQQLSFGGLLSLSFVLGQVNNPLNQLLTFAHSYQEAKLSMQRLLSIQLLKEEVSSNDVELIPGSILFRSFNFKYFGQHKSMIKDLNVVIPQGKTTAIVGESGSGKTTLLRLILGYYQDYDGELLLGEHNLKDLPANLLRSQLSTVMQQGFLFDQSFLYNIILGKEEEIDLERFQRAIEIANLTEFVRDNLRGNLATKIGINGLQLSGGQKQRVLIARALYKNASYFIFDEATSALDTENEAQIMRNLNRYFTGKTVILVAHRLSTIKNADQILVMHEGQLVEQGNHDALCAIKGKYFNLIKNQLA